MVFLGVDGSTSAGYLLGRKVHGEWSFEVSSSFVEDVEATDPDAELTAEAETPNLESEDNPLRE